MSFYKHLTLWRATTPTISNLNNKNPHYPKQNEAQSTHAEWTHKGVNQRSTDVTQAQQHRPELPTATLTWHDCKYKVPKLHQTLTWDECKYKVHKLHRRYTGATHVFADFSQYFCTFSLACVYLSLLPSLSTFVHVSTHLCLPVFLHGHLTKTTVFYPEIASLRLGKELFFLRSKKQ